MREQVARVWGSKFFKSVLILATGTALSQAVILVFSPILTRLYGPDAFGVLGVFLAISGIIAPVAALTYPDAIVLPDSDTEARSVISLAVFIALANALIFLLLFITAGEWLFRIFEADKIRPFFYLIPVVMIFTATAQVLQHWLLRKNSFPTIARATLKHSVVVSCLQAGFGLWLPGAVVLVAINSISPLLKTAMLAATIRNRIDLEALRDGTNLNAMLAAAIKYKDFAKFRAPKIAIGAVSQSMPIIFLGSFVGPEAAGYYTVASAALAMPTQLVGRSVGDVLYPRLAEIYRKGGNIGGLLSQGTIFLAVLSFAPFFLIIILGPSIFELVFGQSWAAAGEYARWLALWVYFSLLNVPSVIAIPVLGLQRIHFYFEIISTLSRAGCLYWGLMLFGTDIAVVACLSLVGVALNIVLIGWVLLLASPREQ
jgi:O-antigen/teichoic acid export membrane protein